MKKFKMAKADVYLIISIVLMILYTIADKLQLVKTGMVNNQLTICFFTAFGTELAYSCVIKVFNIRNEGKIIDMSIDTELTDNKGDEDE